MATAGSNVTLSLVSVSVPTAEIMYSILTSGRYEDGYIAVFDENNTEVSRTSSFRAYGNSSGSTTVTGLSTGHVYTGKFYSSDLSMYSDSVVIIDTRSGTPSYDVSTSMTGTSVTVTLGPISSPATMERDGLAIVDMIAVGGEAPDSPISNSVEYKSADASVSTTFFGLAPTTTYTFLVSYYDPGTSTDRKISITVNTITARSHFVPKFYGSIDDGGSDVSTLVSTLYGGDNLSGATKLKKLYGAVNGETRLTHVNRQKKGPAQGIITLQAQESGTMTIADKWTTPIIVENITQGTTPITVETIDSTSISVEDGDTITIAESSINSTFRYWDQGYYNYRPLISGVACHIIDMPPIDRFTTDLNGTTADDSFFKAFNCNGSITSLPAGSFDISSITTIGDSFFQGFNLQGSLASLPAGSFDISNITTVGNFFFASFNCGGSLTSLPTGSFDTSNITTAGTFFFAGFNSRVLAHPEIVGLLTSLPIGSFDTSNITTIGDYSFAEFNLGGHIPKSTNSYNPNFINSLSSFIDAYYWDGSVSVSEFVQAGDPFYYLES